MTSVLDQKRDAPAPAPADGAADGGERKRTDRSEEWRATARRHLAWSRWAARRDEWFAWQSAQPEEDKPKSGPWALVNRTAAHAAYAEQYAKLPSHVIGWERSKKQRPPRWAQENGVAPKMMGVDCEMCETDVDPRALVGVSVVDEEGEVLLKARRCVVVIVVRETHRRGRDVKPALAPALRRFLFLFLLGPFERVHNRRFFVVFSRSSALLPVCPSPL